MARCHGDLHLGNIVLWQGRPTPFDCIEFSERIAGIDVIYDLAFLLMDLEHRDERGRGNLVLNRYLPRADARLSDFEGLAALPLFLSCRAAVRAHVAADAAKTQADEKRREAELADARSYHGLARRLIAPPPPMLVAGGGVSGTGKSTLARRIAPLLGAVPGALGCRSDVIRKHLFGKGELPRLPPDAYRPQVSSRDYWTSAAPARYRKKIGGGPAARAGIATGDVLISAAGQPLRTFLDLGSVKLDISPGASRRPRPGPFARQTSGACPCFSRARTLSRAAPLSLSVT